MKFEVDQSVFELFPAITFGVVTGDIDAIRQECRGEIAHMQDKVLGHLSSFKIDTASFSDHPHIGAWREIYQKFGVKAKRHKPTHEALVRRLLKDSTWPIINPIVDVYLINQAYHLLPHGGYDLKKLSGDFNLSISQGNELFEPLGGGEEYTSAGEVIYRDDSRILTRRWNYRDCDASKITQKTKHFIIMIESASDKIESRAVNEAAKDLAEKYNHCFYGNFQFRLFLASKSNNSMEIEIAGTQPHHID